MPDPETSCENMVSNSGSGEQNIAQGENAVGKQINDHRTTTQTIEGNKNIAAGRDVRIEHHHYSTPKAESTCILPAEDDIFLHREDELTWLNTHLSPDRVVAVCGPGGMGKSALAARALRSLPPDRFPDGIIFHTFYHQAEIAKALQTIARALGLKAEADPEQEVAAALGNRQALLILDGAEEAEDLPAVLRLRGQCGVLITTRRKSDCGPLRLDLQPLPDDQAEEVLRAWGGDAGDQVAIEQIAELLGGWPVALRLAGHYLHSTGEPAADYLRWLQEEPFKELGEREEHQRDNAALLLERSTAQVGDDARLVLGLAGTLAFDLLSPAPMTALLEGDERRCRRAVNELVNYGLLERRGDRLHIGHALIHEYAARHLALSKEGLERVAWYYIFFCTGHSMAGVPGYARLDDERAHFLRLMESCLASELWLEVQVLEGTIDTYLDRQCWWTERLAALEMRQTTAQQTGNRRDEGVCLNSFGCLFNKRGEIEEALSCFKQSLSIRRDLGDRQGESMTLNNIAESYRQQGNYKLALQIYQESLSIKQEIGDRKGEGVTLSNIALLYKDQGDYDQALSYYEQCLPIRQETSDKIGEGTTLNNIATIYYAQGNSTKAIEQYKQALAIRREQGDRAGEAESCWNIGRIYEDMNDLGQAEEYIALAVEIEEQIGHPDLENDRKALERVRAERRAG